MCRLAEVACTTTKLTVAMANRLTLTPALVAASALALASGVGCYTSDANAARSSNVYRYAGLYCETSSSARGVACVRGDNKGYAVRAVATNVAVQNAAGRIVYEKLNSRVGGPARRFPFTGRTLIDFDAIRCTAKVPAQIACARSDGTGFGVVITKTSVSVIRLVDGKRIYSHVNP